MRRGGVERQSRLNTVAFHYLFELVVEFWPLHSKSTREGERKGITARKPLKARTEVGASEEPALVTPC